MEYGDTKIILLLYLDGHIADSGTSIIYRDEDSGYTYNIICINSYMYDVFIFLTLCEYKNIIFLAVYFKCFIQINKSQKANNIILAYIPDYLLVLTIIMFIVYL